MPPTEVDALLEGLTDPPNKYVRYPLARALYRVAHRLPFTPNQVSFFHGAIGIVAAFLVALGPARLFPLVYLLTELRAVLDCYDGVLARGKKLFSANGRVIDEVSDAVSFVAISVGVAYRIHTWTALIICILTCEVSGIAAWAFDFFKRKISSALRGGPDNVIVELRPKHRAVEAKTADGLMRFSYWFDTMQVRVLSPRSRDEIMGKVRDESLSADSADMINVLSVARTRPKYFRIALRGLAVMTGDNSFTLFALGILTGQLVWAQTITLAFSVVTVLMGIGFGRSLLRGSKA
jgi:phosphatidylglycerophosphate synthase